MKYLYAPWRSKYVEEQVRSKQEQVSEKDCIFCKEHKENDDAKKFILRRFPYHYVMLNRYPYNAGHLLIIPYEHVAQLYEQSQEAQQELIALVGASTKIVQDTLGAQGVNIGLNLGKAAGAGIPAHIHTHILPRWDGDTNFLPTLAQTKQISVDLHTIYKKLHKGFEAL